jgi:hypothetical protein
MKTIYIADDGKEFEDEDECLEYEKIEKMKAQNVINEIHAFDDNFKEINIKDYLESYNLCGMLRHIYHVKFDSLNAATYFDTLLNDYNDVRISKDNELKADIYTYNDMTNSWESATERLAQYQEIIDKFAHC